MSIWPQITHDSQGDSAAAGGQAWAGNEGKGWLPAFAGMTEGVRHMARNRTEELRDAVRRLPSQVIKDNTRPAPLPDPNEGNEG